MQPHLPKSVLALTISHCSFATALAVSANIETGPHTVLCAYQYQPFLVFSDMQIIDMVGLPRTASRSPGPNSSAYSLKTLLMLHRPKFTPDSDMVSKSFSLSLGVLVVASSSRGLEFSVPLDMYFSSGGAANALVWLVFGPVR